MYKFIWTNRGGQSKYPGGGSSDSPKAHWEFNCPSNARIRSCSASFCSFACCSPTLSPSLPERESEVVAEAVPVTPCSDCSCHCTARIWFMRYSCRTCAALELIVVADSFVRERLDAGRKGSIWCAALSFAEPYPPCEVAWAEYGINAGSMMERASRSRPRRRRRILRR